MIAKRNTLRSCITATQTQTRQISAVEQDEHGDFSRFVKSFLESK